jgi:hypothetical protein
MPSEETSRTTGARSAPEVEVPIPATSVAEPTVKGTVATKFSDLAAFHQSLQTRLALALAAFALTAAAAGRWQTCCHRAACRTALCRS